MLHTATLENANADLISTPTTTNFSVHRSFQRLVRCIIGRQFVTNPCSAVVFSITHPLLPLSFSNQALEANTVWANHFTHDTDERICSWSCSSNMKIIWEINVAVAVDDVQFFPVISETTRVAQQSLIFPNGVVCASIRVASIRELITLGLTHLFRGNQSIEQDNWECLHVTIAITAKAEAVECQFTATLFYSNDSEVCTEEIWHGNSEEAHKLQQLGCLLTPSSKNDAASYAQCTVEIPAFLTHGG